MRKFISGLVFIALTALPVATAWADAAPFSDNKEINLQMLLPPPPVLDSPQMKAELGEILTLQVTRTPAQEARAKADAVEDIWRFADAVNNPKFTPENLPKFAAFFDRVVATEGAVDDPYKAMWARPRPHIYSSLVHPAVPLSSSGSYPSGHSASGTLMGIVLANMLPEKRTEIMARAWEFANNRLVGGIHYRSDVEEGRVAGTLIAAVIMEHPDFKTEFDAAKAELRAALGM